jgi:hypothetical protein
LPAKFLAGIAHACLQMNDRAEAIFAELKDLPLGAYLGEAFSEMAGRFLSASCADYARCIAEAARRFGCTCPGMESLLKVKPAAAAQ